MKKVLLSLLIMLALCARANHWTPDEYQYPNSMTLIGVIAFDDVEQRSESLEIGAFCAEECRGSAIAQYDTNFDRYYVCIMIYGNDGDSVCIRCYDHGIGMEVDAISLTSFIFNTNDMIGNAVEPVVFSFDIPDIPEDPIYYQVTAEANPLECGTIDGVGTYLDRDTCILQITTCHDYVYEGLYDNDTLVSTDTLYSFIVTSDRHFVAKFSEEPDNPDEPIYYQITATIKPEGAGIIIGLGEYQEGELCSLSITANEGYCFVSLNENGEIISVEQNYSFEVESDHNFTVNFIPTESIEEKIASFQFYPNPVDDILYVITEVEIEEVVVYDAFGRQRDDKTTRQGEAIIDVSRLDAGVYFVRIKTAVGFMTKRFVKI